LKLFQDPEFAKFLESYDKGQPFRNEETVSCLIHMVLRKLVCTFWGWLQVYLGCTFAKK